MFTIKTFRYIALAEATSFLLLLTASAFKRIPDPPPDSAETAVLILGMLHGLLFVSYVLVALTIREDERWTGKETLLILIGAVVPFGGYAVDRWLARRDRGGTA